MNDILESILELVLLLALFRPTAHLVDTADFGNAAAAEAEYVLKKTENRILLSVSELPSDTQDTPSICANASGPCHSGHP